MTATQMWMNPVGDLRPSIKMDSWTIVAWGGQNFEIAPGESQYGIFAGVADARWTFAPRMDGYLHLGTPGRRWEQLHAKNATISTSDRNQKKDIGAISDKHITLFTLLQPVTYRFIDGSSGRLHVGFISQDVETAMTQVGLSDLDFAGFCRDEVDGTVIYSLRYEEFIALNTAMIQRQQAQINRLEQRLEHLEKKVAASL